jgi:hypothetical protein
VGLDEGQFFHADREHQYHNSVIKQNRASGQLERKNKEIYHHNGLGGLVVSVLATGLTGYSVAGSSPTEDGGFLWVIKIPSTHLFRKGSKAVGPMS